MGRDDVLPVGGSKVASARGEVGWIAGDVAALASGASSFLGGIFVSADHLLSSMAKAACTSSEGE